MNYKLEKQLLEQEGQEMTGAWKESGEKLGTERTLSVLEKFTSRVVEAISEKLSAIKFPDIQKIKGEVDANVTFPTIQNIEGKVTVQFPEEQKVLVKFPKLQEIFGKVTALVKFPDVQKVEGTVKAEVTFPETQKVEGSVKTDLPVLEMGNSKVVPIAFWDGKRIIAPPFGSVSGDGKLYAALRDLIALIDGQAEMAMKQVVSGDITYVALAPAGTGYETPAWQVFKIDETTGFILTWADGDPNFDNLATDLAGLTYA